MLRELDPEGAVADYRKAFEAPRADVVGGVYADPTDLWLRAMFFREQGDFDQALADCEAGLELATGELISWATFALTRLSIDLHVRRGDLHSAAHLLGLSRHTLYLEDQSALDHYLLDLRTLLEGRALPPPVSGWAAVGHLRGGGDY